MSFQSINIWHLLAGIGIFLFAMSLLEEALKRLSGAAFKRLLRKHTSRPLVAILSGALVTAVLQSSSVVTLMLLALVGSGVITFQNSIGVILGANLGTTATGWIVSILGFKLDIQSFALAFVAVGSLIIWFFKKYETLPLWGNFIFAFGLLFLGLDYMNTSVQELTVALDISALSKYGNFVFFLAGLAITALIQSSSACVVIILSALHAKALVLDQAAFMVVGADLGTTITAILGAAGDSPGKKRVAATHVFFNVVNGVIAFLMLPFLLQLLQSTLKWTDPLLLLVAFHSSIKLIGIVIFFPFIKSLAEFFEKRFIPKRIFSSHYIHLVPHTQIEEAIVALKYEAIALCRHVMRLNAEALKISTAGFQTRQYIHGSYWQRYETVKEIEGEAIEYSLHLLEQQLSEDQSKELDRLLQSIRKASQSAKDIKDIFHNLIEFERSGNDSVLEVYQNLRQHAAERCTSIEQCIEEHNRPQTTEILNKASLQNQLFHNSLRDLIHQGIRNHKIDDVSAATLINVNYEVFSAYRALNGALGFIIEPPLDYSKENRPTPPVS